MIKFALAGNPNSGKTTLFNSLTGSTAHVGNWPGVTVDKKEGTYKKCEKHVGIVDLPGIYSLSPYTPEEVISRNYILDEKPDCVINIVDATNLERNLYLTTQIMEIDVPMVIALNMMDAVEKSGDKIDAVKLEEKIGIPVIPISALREKGLDELMKRAYEEAQKPRKGTTVLEDSSLIHLIGDCKIALKAEGVDNALFHAIKLVELDEIEVKAHPKATIMVEEFKKTFSDDVFGNDFEALVADSRYKCISKNYSNVLTKKHKNEKEKLSKSDKADKVLTHRFWGIPLFLIILFFVFHLTFSEDLLYLGKAGVFKKTVYAYDASGSAITQYYDASGNALTSLTDVSGNLLELYDKSGNKYDVFYDNDGKEAEIKVENGVVTEVSAIAYAYDAQGKPIKNFYDNLGNKIAKLTKVDGELLSLYNSTGIKYEAFYMSDGKLAKIELEDNGEFKEAVYASDLDKFLSEITVNTFFGYEKGVYSPGVILFNALDTLTSLTNTAARQGLTNAGAPQWAIGLICDGILGGLFAILSFLPQILLLFLFFSILEDSGYMARVAFILDRIFRRFGLSGRAFMPMIMGFGCSIPAMINTRTLADQNERTATIRVIPFFSCGAKLPILTAIAGGIVQIFKIGNADAITYGMYVLGVVTAIVSVLLMRGTTMRGETAPFIMELPSYHAPQFKNLMIHLWDKAKHFVKKAFTIILASTIVIWFVSHFTWAWTYVPDELINTSMLASIGQFIQPIFTPLGFGSQLNSWGWVFAVAAITGLIAKENVIATFGTLGALIAGAMIDIEADGGIAAVAAMIGATGITVPALIAFIAFNMTTIPCFAAVATAKAELPTKKSFNMTILFWLGTSYLVATMIYLIGSWWWTLFIFLALWAVAITLIILNYKGKINVKEWFALKKNKKIKE